jgi:hypothetical protein
MKIGNPTVKLNIVIEYNEVRFTVSGKLLCLISAADIEGMRFEIWEDIYTEELGDMKKGEALEITGHAWTRDYRTLSGEDRQTQVFTVKSWKKIENYSVADVSDMATDSVSE